LFTSYTQPAGWVKAADHPISYEPGAPHYYEAIHVEAGGTHLRQNRFFVTSASAFDLSSLFRMP
jgi:hypothetical protein